MKTYVIYGAYTGGCKLCKIRAANRKEAAKKMVDKGWDKEFVERNVRFVFKWRVKIKDGIEQQ